MLYIDFTRTIIFINLVFLLESFSKIGCFNFKNDPEFKKQKNLRLFKFLIFILCYKKLA